MDVSTQASIVPALAASPTRGQRLAGLATNPWFAFLTILILQLGIVRYAWQQRDLTSGDTSSYFLHAWEWYTRGEVNIAWSPLYTAFYGAMLFVTTDVYTATLLHRLVIVCAATLLVLAVMRRLLPAQLAWCVAVWWAVLPINFNTLYEIHLFALLPVLAAWLTALACPGVWGRGLCLGILAAATVLVRAELSVACGLFGLCCLVYEWCSRRGTAAKNATGWRAVLVAYAIPLMAGAALSSFFYARSTVRRSELNQTLNAKHTLNMSQVFTFGYQQRHPQEKRVSPWYEYHQVMEEHFGNALPTLSQMIAANPAAVWEHFLWNFRLTPNGLQVLLFNATSGRSNPDYAPVITESRTALWLSMVLGLVWLAGLATLLRQRQYWWNVWLKPRAFAWCAMFAVACVAMAVIPTQRPRPSYLFSLSVPLMALTGMCVMVLSAQMRRLSSLAPLAAPLMIACVALVPLAYQSSSAAVPRLRNLVERMKPFERLLKMPAVVLLQEGYNSEVMSYVGKSRRRSHFYHELLRDWSENTPLTTILEQKGVNLLVLEESLLQKLEARNRDGDTAFVSESRVGDWQLLASHNLPHRRWRIFARPPIAPGNRDASSASSRHARLSAE